MKEGYVVLRNFIPKDIITFALDTWKRMELDPEMSGHLYLEDDIIQNSPEDTLYKSNGMWGSPFGVALHHWIWKELKNHIDMDLGETYSYTRKYQRGAYLKAHADRPSCEISTTVNLGGDPWPIFIDGTGSDNVIDEYKKILKPNAPKGTKVLLEVGDMLVYSGCELEHWREPFEGDVCGQVFLHYNHVNGPFAEKNRFDKRPMLGVPPIRNM